MIICQYMNICFATALASQLLADEEESLMFFLFVLFFYKSNFLHFHLTPLTDITFKNTQQCTKKSRFPQASTSTAEL